MKVLRFLLLACLGVWLGALIFFPVVAATAFANLPPHSAAVVVRGSLLKLHWMAFACGIAFLVASLIYNRIALGRTRIISLTHMLVALMLALTAISQFRIIPRMESLRLAAGDISALSSSDPLRAQFDTLHTWSTRTEEAVLVLGLLLLYFTSRQLAEHM